MARPLEILKVSGIMMMVRKVAVHKPVTKVIAILPQITEYSGMPRAIGSRPRVVVRVVSNIGLSRI